MSEARCVLCGQVAGEGAKQFTMTPEAAALYKRETGDSPDAGLARNVLCARCDALPQADRRQLAAKAVQRELAEMAQTIKREKGYPTEH